MSHAQGESSSLTPSGSENGSTLIHNIGQLKVPQLKGLCRSLGLSPAAKRKQDLFERVLHFIESNQLADNAAELLAIDLLVMKLLNNDTIPSFMHLVQLMRSGVVNQQGVSNSMQQFRQASGLSRPMAPRQIPTNQSQLRQAGYSNSHTPTEDTYNGPMLLFRSTLLYNIRSVVGPAQVLRASKGRFAKQFAIRLSSSELQLLNSSKNMRLYIFSGVEATPDSSNAKIQFPPIEIYVDGVLTKQFLRGIKGKAGTARPADITPYITRDSKPSHVRIVYSDAAEKYILYPHIVEEFQPSSIVEKIDARPHISAIHTKQKIKQETEAAEDDDIQVATASLSLRCPITYARIKFPFTSVECDHIQCFDGLSFLTMQQRIPAWQCPVCSNTISEDSLCVSDYIKEILDSVPEEVDTVKLEADGSWTIASEDDLKAETSKQQFEEPATTSNDVNADENIEIISLDSESDEETEPAVTIQQTNPRVEVANDSSLPAVPQVTPPNDQVNEPMKSVPESPILRKDSDSRLPETQTTEVSTALVLQTNAPTDEEARVVPERTHQSILNDDAATSTVDPNQDSDDDRVLATYRKATRPKIDAVATTESHGGSRPETPDTNNTSDLTPFPESNRYVDTVDEVPIPLQQSEPGERIEKSRSSDNIDPKGLGLLEPVGGSVVESNNTQNITPGSSNTLTIQNEVSSERTEVTHNEAPNTPTLAPPPNQEQNDGETTRIQTIEKVQQPVAVRENNQSTQSSELQQGEVRIRKHPTPSLNGTSIISTIHDQISRSASPFLSMSPKTTAVRNVMSNHSNPGTNPNYKPQNLQDTERPPTTSSNRIDSSGHSWSAPPGTGALSAENFRAVAKRPVENVYAQPEGSQSLDSRGAPPRINNQNIRSFHNAAYGSGSQPLLSPASNFRPFVPRNPSPSFPGNSHHEEERNQSRTNYESRGNQAYHEYRVQAAPQDNPQHFNQNENIPLNDHQDSSWNQIYGIPDNRNVHMARNPHVFSRSVSFNGNYQGNTMNRPPTIPYSHLIAMSSSMINAYNKSMSNNTRSAVRVPPPARRASSIAKNTAFEFMNQRQHPVKEPQVGASGPITPTMERSDNSSKHASDPMVSNSDTMHDGSRFVGASSTTSPATAMIRRHSGSHGFNHTRNGLENPGQYANSAFQGIAVAAAQGLSSDKPQTMLKGLLGIEIASNALSSVEPRSDPISENNSFSHDDTLQNSTAISLDNHIQDMSIQTPANRKRTIDEPSSASKRSSRPEKFNVHEINSSDIIELESD